MEKLSVEEKAKRYDETVGKLRGMMPNWERLSYNGKTFLQDLTYIFPELAESEDEKVKKALVELVHDTTGDSLWVDYNVHKEDALAWLEKQGEKGTNRNNEEIPFLAWSEEDEDNFKHLLDEIVCLGNNRNSANRLYYDRLIKFIKELKNRAQPKEKWCDKDERMLDRLIAYFEKQVAFTDDDNPRYANWLKSLRPQNTWKLSNEQIKALEAMLTVSPQSPAMTSALIELYQNLKKLREE